MCRSPGFWATKFMALIADYGSISSSKSARLCSPSAITRSCGRRSMTGWASMLPPRWRPPYRKKRGSLSRRGAGREGGQPLSAGAGAKGERFYDWARVRLMRLQQPPWDHWLLVRRHPSKPDQFAYYVVFGPADTTLATLARVAGRRWAIEECFEVAKQEVGLTDYEIRSRHGWYRHVTLAMLALAFLA